MTGIRIVFPYQAASAACPLVAYPYPSVLTYLAASFPAAYLVIASFLVAYLTYLAFTTAFASADRACPMVAWSIAASVVKLLPSVC